jgi:hypothetical protein
VTSTVVRRCYRMVTVAMDEDVISAKTVSTEGHNSSDITDKPL